MQVLLGLQKLAITIRASDIEKIHREKEKKKLRIATCSIQSRPIYKNSGFFLLLLESLKSYAQDLFIRVKEGEKSGRKKTLFYSINTCVLMRDLKRNRIDLKGPPFYLKKHFISLLLLL